MAILLMVAGAFLFIDGLVLIAISNIDTGLILTALSGLVFLSWGVFYKKVKKLTDKGVFKVVKIVIISLVAIEILFAGFLAIYGERDNVTYQEDALIVLGGGTHNGRVSAALKARLDKAIEYHEKNPDAVIVVTGGLGYGEPITEAEAMKNYLAEHGIDERKIIKEEKATSTKENMVYSKEILDEYFESDYKIAIITNNFHIFRGMHLAKAKGFQNVTHLHSELAWYVTVPCYLRESLAMIKTLAID